MTKYPVNQAGVKVDSVHAESERRSHTTLKDEVIEMDTTQASERNETSRGVRRRDGIKSQ
jgi:hypothetical protein